jgi:hypothetical protein
MGDSQGTQDMLHEEAPNPSVAPTEEAQDMSTLGRIVVPMPSHTDPSNPLSASGSVNMTLENHPVEHSEDYGAMVEPGEFSPEGTMDQHALEVVTGEEGGGRGSQAPSDEERVAWTKDDWKAKAAEYELAVGGTKADLQKRVEEHEAEQEAYKDFSASDWQDAIDECEDEDQLAELRAAYDASGADYSTVVTAFDKAAAEFTES